MAKLDKAQTKCVNLTLVDENINAESIEVEMATDIKYNRQFIEVKYKVYTLRLSLNYLTFGRLI